MPRTKECLKENARPQGWPPPAGQDDGKQAEFLNSVKKMAIKNVEAKRMHENKKASGT
uniref:Uncharacterized protein n=1 Tax=Arion vulgaris TaxID=1028688 RepID=A0A0B7BXD0_9EUPU